ncbi:GNAT family N-acetyltransferase [Patescibacteria group bacterium]|nr:GNAT family N-acetyltransferase [Patescibacteria group bacterium]
MKINIEHNPNKKDIEVIQEGLKEHNKKFTNPDNHEKLSVLLKDDDGKVLGGLLGGTYWDWLHIDSLWLDESMRNQGYGQQLLQEAEKEAIKRGCKHVHLDSHDFQAVEFYKKNGYIIAGQLDDLPEGYTRYLMKKDLA